MVGARLYHVITDYQLFEDDPLRVFAIWRGGLSIWGAVAGGAIAVVVLTRRRHLPTLVVMDCMSVGIVLAQAIGRFGNYFNQELFGGPTDLPVGRSRSPSRTGPPDYAQYTTFHPTFLYESLACLAIVGVLVGSGAPVPAPPGPDVRPLRRAATPSPASSSRTCASTRRTRSGRCG